MHAESLPISPRATSQLRPARRGMSSSRHARRVLHTLAAGVLALAAAACENGLAVADEAQEQLLFVRAEGDPQRKDIYRMNADGSGVENLTRQPASIYRSLSLSPDGTRVVYNSDRSGCYAIWGMNTDGTAPQQLTGVGGTPQGCNYAPRWSRDGTRIAFTSTREQNWAVYVMNADGTSPRNVSSPVEKSAGPGYPVGWTPDGRVVFQYARQTGGAVSVQTYVVNADGTGLMPLLAAEDEFPVWSPDGSRIAFISSRGGTRSVYVMRADGSDVRRVSNLPGEVTFAQSWGHRENDRTPWSPDGTRIAFNNLGEQGGLYVVNADGSDLRLLSAAGEFNGWSPSGRRIAFTGTAAGSKDIFVINADGSGLVNLTPGGADDTDALWLPRRR